MNNMAGGVRAAHLISFCVVYFCFVGHHPVSCVASVASVDCPFLITLWFSPSVASVDCPFLITLCFSPSVASVDCPFLITLWFSPSVASVDCLDRQF
jgi:hypothetical protein